MRSLLVEPGGDSLRTVAKVRVLYADTDAMVITVREAASGEVIRQIPSEEALQMRRYLDEWSGTFLNVTT